MVTLNHAPICDDLIIQHPDNFPTHEETAQFHSRASRIGNAYLQGRPIFIQSAHLKGPFNSSWQNPWLREVRKQKAFHHHHSRQEDAPSSPTKYNTQKHGERLQRSQSSLDDTASRQRDVATRKCAKETRKPEGVDHSSGPKKPRPAKHNTRNEGGEDARPSPSDSAQSTSSPARDVGLDDTRADPDHTPNVRHPCSVTFELPAFERRLRRPKVKSSLKKTCAWCGTRDSYNWRKGPDGPGTLCSSCGGKWTHQQTRARQEHFQPVETASPAHSAPMTDACRSGNEARATDAKIGAMPLTHEQICSAMFPENDVRDAVTSNRATRLEELLFAEVMELRGQPSPSMKRWDQSPSGPQIGQGSPQVLKPSQTASPRSKPIRSLDGAADEVSRHSMQRRSARPKRKVFNFDTPLAAPARPQKAMYNTKDSQPTSSPLLYPKIIDEARQARLPLEQEQHSVPAKSPITDAKGSQSSSRRTSAAARFVEMSTQAALIQARNAFQDNSHSFEGSSRSLSLSATHLHTPPSFGTPQRSPLRQSLSTARMPICTQDIFDQTLRFGSPSPTKPSQLTQLSRLPRLSEEGIQGLIFPNEETTNLSAEVKKADLPTSPPISHDEFDVDDNKDHDGETATMAASQTARQGRYESYDFQQDTPSPPLLSSASKSIQQSSQARDAFLYKHVDGSQEEVDVDGIIAEAGNFLDSWKTQVAL